VNNKIEEVFVANPQGVYCANLTPFEPNGGPPIAAAFVEHGQKVLADGCDGLSIFGTTGEANSMTVHERIDLMRALVDGRVDPKQIMPGVGCAAIGDTVTLAKYALSLGITDLLMLPPFYYKGVNDAGLYDAYAQTIDQVADDRLRLYFYNIPAVSGISITTNLIRQIQAAYPEIVAGVKDTSFNVETMRSYNAISDLRVFVGTETLLLENLRLGGAGTIAAFANVGARQLQELHSHWQQPDAEALQAGVSENSKLFEGLKTISALKAIVEKETGDSAWRTVRPPLRAFDDDEAAAVAEAWRLATL
jgi:4-hydroxy-tetrahydrodipicolinate synthase